MHLAVERGLGPRTVSAYRRDVTAYLADVARRPASAVALTKALLYELDDLGVEEGVERAAHVNVQARMTEACREGVRRFLERSRGTSVESG